MYEKIILDYNFEDLEPYIDARTVEIHYTNHYGTYVDKLNALLQKNGYDYRYTKEELVSHIDEFPESDRENIAFNLGGVLNHELYFMSMSNKKQNHPHKALVEKLLSIYPSYEDFMKQVIEIGTTLKGSGYVFLCKDKNNELKLIKLSNQDTPYNYGLIPLMALDVWEHAYYLKYQYKRIDYLNNFFSVIDYEKIEKRFIENM